MATLSGVITSSESIPANFTVTSLRNMPLPGSVLMCPPTYFEVLDVKNAFMEGQLGKVDRKNAISQWEELKSSYEQKGVGVEVLEPLEGCEDMVFCANPVFPGIDEKGRRKCVLSRMTHPSRQREVCTAGSCFERNGYELVDFRQKTDTFEGGGDAIWHPGRGLIWGGYGQRTGLGIYSSLAEVFDVPIITLEIQDSRFYHLDTCFCPIDEETVLLYPAAFSEEGLSLIRRLFPRIVEANQYDTAEKLACNAAAFLGKYIFIQRGASNVTTRLRELEYEVIEVETGEFLKSGGSVFCMKSALF
jgi:arginine dihydrolase